MDIQGTTIGIRTYRRDDTESFCKAVLESTKHLKPFMPWCHENYSLAESDTWVTSRLQRWEQQLEYSFIIYSLQDNELIGSVDINQINTTHKTGNIGYWVRKKYLNQGIATNAVKLISKFGFDTLMLKRLEIIMLTNNLASKKVAEKAGAHFEGRLKNRLLVNDCSFDAFIYSIIN